MYPEPLKVFLFALPQSKENGPNDEALWASQNVSDGFLRTATDQSKTSVLAPDPTLHGLNNWTPLALVIEQTRNAVSHNKGKPPLLSTDDLDQPDAKPEHQKIEAPVLFRGPVAIGSAISLVPKVHAKVLVRTLILNSLSMIRGRFSIKLEKSGTAPFLVEHERPGYKSLSLSRQSTLWPLEMHSVPPLQNTLGWWCIYATISSSSLEDHKGCKASPGTEDAGVDVSWRYGLGTNLIEENSIPPLRDKIELDIFLKQPMQEVMAPIKCFNPIRVFITIDWRVPIASSSLKDPPRRKMPYLDDRESVQAESANGVASLQTSFVAMWQIAWAAGHCLLYSWACQGAPGVVIIPVVRCFCIYGVLLFWISVFLLIISAQNWWCLHEEYLFLYIMVLSLKTKSRRDFPNFGGISCEPCAYTKTTLERGPLKLTTAYGFGGSSMTSIDRAGGDDRFKVSRLEGFVSNREQSYEDPIEELLYAVFVVASENATVAESAATLQADLSQLQTAASFACQLGGAVKLIDPASVLQDSNVHGSQASGSSANMSTDGNSVQQDYSGMEDNKPAFNTARVAFIVDANITSYLMMGSVSPGFKSHAVTLYEAGQLDHTCIGDLCKDLSTLEGAKFEGELQEFANHASSLRCVLECLLSGGVSASVREVEGCDGMDLSSVHSIVTNSTSVDTTLTDKPEYTDSYYAADSDNAFLTGKKEVACRANLCAYQFWQRLFKDKLHLEHLKCLLDVNGAKASQTPSEEALDVAEADKHDEIRKCLGMPFVSSGDFQTRRVAEKFVDVVKEIRVEHMQESINSRNGYVYEEGSGVNEEALLCKFFLKSLCTRSTNCLFSHSLQAKRPACKFFTSLQGCRKGDSCLFSHDVSPSGLLSSGSGLCTAEDDNVDASALVKFFNGTVDDRSILILDDT
ncbi:hypothetical protein Nepgr_008750 [Nepenthes gracilis]|uniref:C3H1-type domain-containing protein n=1 Tax=Nepenthes gracilis TaxID=150966 RepID=A0AAD3S9N5_NEPGR|nr:hypothetical protein Nepgr_008750 [Nepenthes gracilis]